MSCYRFEVWESQITPIEVEAESEREAREMVLRRDLRVDAFDTAYSGMRLVLCSVEDE